MQLLKVAMLQAIITVKFEINCMATNGDFNQIKCMLCDDVYNYNLKLLSPWQLWKESKINYSVA